MSGGAAVEDASWRGCTDGAGLRADHRENGSVSVWQADRVLSGTGSRGRVQWRTATTRTHHETGELSVALLAGVTAQGTVLSDQELRMKIFPLELPRGPKIRHVAIDQNV